MKKMRILIVSNEYQNDKRQGNPIIDRIIAATKTDKRVENVLFCPFTNSFGCFPKIRYFAKKCDIVHIHFGGIYAFLVWFALIGVNIPKLLTFHGTDVHGKEILTTKSILAKIRIRLNQFFSFLSVFLFNRVGFVSESLINYIPPFVRKCRREQLFIQPLGVDYDIFKPINKTEAQTYLGLIEGNYILFSDKTNTPLKRKDIAEAIVSNLDDYRLLLMCGVKPDMVPYYINASDFTLLTSDEEGSPNITRETLAVNHPVFSVDVGDVKYQLVNLVNSSIISREPIAAAKVIKDTLEIPYTDNTRETLRNKLDMDFLIKDIIDIYEQLIK